ncbi:putative rhomboid family membrane protein [Diplogelasinospora grovesii]|uniref:Rhomboid-type serine protease n=1 Tax=Diplogelasinospora grovesii TaxID=303347 RepID=A0AAN6NHU4_9PEZI|nr:putative rhomboid family membrane protein [Diplogelasinospora grovesii]
MDANEYYSRKPLPSPSPQQHPSQYQYGVPASSAASTYSTPPSYSSQPHLAAHDRPPQSASPAPNAYSHSPFETVFDDHVYPASSHQTPSSSQHQLSQQQDPDYHRLSRTPSEEMAYNHPTDDIPLQNQSQRDPTKDGDMEDHVYDAPQQNQRRKSRKGRVQFGELGMLGANSKKIPWVVYLFTVVQVAVFIGEIVKNATATGSPIMIQPQFNPMIGPSPYILINMGARFVPCMHNVNGVQNSKQIINWPCPNTTTLDATSPSQHCTLSELCGFGGVPEPFYNSTATMDQKPEPNQWFRFIVPIFLHAGIIHIGFNLLLQLTMGREMEKSIGSIRFFLVYVSAGIFGFVMGGNFAATGISSTGASGSLFGVIALTLLDLLYSWKDRLSPVKDLMYILLDVIISFVLGLLPGLDNFSHIGGFLMGLALGICVLHSPNALRRRIGDDAPYANAQVSNGYLSQGSPPAFHKNPIGFFKGRKPLWWAWWLIRAGALVLVTVVFILLLNNFYIYHNTCSWCKYLSCLPVNNWCETGNLQITANQTKRDVILGGLEQMTNLY